MKKLLTINAVLGTLLLASCNNDKGKDYLPPLTEVKLKSHSEIPDFLIKKSGFQSVKVYSLFGSADSFEETPNYIFGGSADGAGLLKDGDSYQFFVNNEDNYAISKITLDETFKPVAGAYVLNSDGSGTRVCSATLATPDEHGFGPVFISAGESGPESQIKGLLPDADPNSASSQRPLPALGRWNAENAMPLNKNAYEDKTIVIIGDDDSGSYGGQVAMYVSDRGNLNQGKVYVLRRKDMNMVETEMKEGETFDVEFVEVENAESNTGEQNNMAAQELKAVPFGRVEDIDYRKGEGKAREVYFNVTGQNNSGSNADYSRSKYGRVYRLELDENNPLDGKLTLILDGDNREGKASMFQNPDNICVTENYIYVQEDPNGYGDETHDAYLYQYDIATGELKVAFELDHDRNGTGEDVYGGRDSRFGAWEYGALLDISETVGMEDVFMLCVQPHTWKKDEFKGVDGGSVRPNEKQGSQVVVLQGLPR